MAPKKQQQQESAEDAFVPDLLESSRLSCRSSCSGIMCSIPEDLALEDWDAVDAELADHEQQQFVMAWAGILRNEVLLMDIGEEDVPPTVLETAAGLLEREPVLGWETFAVSPQERVRGLRFHVFDDQLKTEDDEITVWIFCCVYNSDRLGETEAKQFVQDHMVGLTQTLRAVDPAWRSGDYHASQNLFAPVLQQRMERLSDEYSSSNNKKNVKKQQQQQSNSSSPDLFLSESIIEENRRVMESHLDDESCEDSDHDREHREHPPDLEGTDSSSMDMEDGVLAKELMEVLTQSPSTTNQEQTSTNSTIGVVPTTPERQEDESKTDEVIQVVCLVEDQIMADSPHQDLFNKTPDTISKVDATNYELGGKMLADGADVDDDASESSWEDLVEILKIPKLDGTGTAANKLAVPALCHNHEDDEHDASTPSIKPLLSKAASNPAQDYNTIVPPVPVDAAYDCSPTSVAKDFTIVGDGTDEAILVIKPAPAPACSNQTNTKPEVDAEEDKDGLGNCFFFRLLAPKKPAFVG